jgi:hypothetical protein
LAVDINMPFGPLSDDYEEEYEAPKKKKKTQSVVKAPKKLSMFNTP